MISLACIGLGCSFYVFVAQFSTFWSRGIFFGHSCLPDSRPVFAIRRSQCSSRLRYFSIVLSLSLFSPLLATFNQFAISDCLPAIYSQLFALISPWQTFSLHVAQKLDADSAVVSFGPCRFLLIMHRHRRLDQGLSYSLTTTVQLILYRIRHKWYMNGAPIDHLYAYEMSLFACHMYLQSNDSLLLLCSHAC